MPTTIMWFRRDLRLVDNPALVAAARAGSVVALFCLDTRLLDPAGANRVAFLLRTLRALDASLDRALVVRRGDPVAVVPALAREVGAAAVYATADFAPYGAARDDRVRAALDVPLHLVSSPYAVAPGTVRNGSGEPYKVFTPFKRAWRAAGWPAPIKAPRAPRWVNGVASDGIPDDPRTDAALPAAGEVAAKQAARAFWDRHLSRYDTQRDRPDLDATSRLSPYLKFGALHPRQLLALLDGTDAHRVFADELCWREFYADVLFHQPRSARETLQSKMRGLEVDTGAVADARFDAWATGRTGYPLIDAGMRQLLAEGWMHNRARMATASFLVKDLHVDWRRGARHFMRHLVDGDLASNQHGWQWTAGTGTDAAPFFRVFSPARQAARFDPDEAYVRRWVPEYGSDDYPAPIVEHAVEREDALRRYAALR
ncbi:MAG TPA: deoxyribodipyrimidine photo-lyase [Acidimicrobiales bacterium]|nr:deoxyribodipyrimidine photo-lyase [Acidimicrobiales bacterium]